MRVGQGPGVGEMDLRSMLVSSASTEFTTVRVSSDKAECIRIIAFTCDL